MLTAFDILMISFNFHEDCNIIISILQIWKLGLRFQNHYPRWIGRQAKVCSQKTLWSECLFCAYVEGMCWNPNALCDDLVIRMEPWWMGLVSSYNRPHGAPSALLPCENTRRWRLSINQRSASWTERNQYLLFRSYPICGILLQPSKQTKTTYDNAEEVGGPGVPEHCSGITTAVPLGLGWKPKYHLARMYLWSSSYLFDSSTTAAERCQPHAPLCAWWRISCFALVLSGLLRPLLTSKQSSFPWPHGLCSLPASCVDALLCLNFSLAMAFPDVLNPQAPDTNSEVSWHAFISTLCVLRPLQRPSSPWQGAAAFG